MYVGLFGLGYNVKPKFEPMLISDLFNTLYFLTQGDFPLSAPLNQKSFRERYQTVVLACLQKVDLVRTNCEIRPTVHTRCKETFYPPGSSKCCVVVLRCLQYGVEGHEVIRANLKVNTG